MVCLFFLGLVSAVVLPMAPTCCSSYSGGLRWNAGRHLRMHVRGASSGRRRNLAKIPSKEWWQYSCGDRPKRNLRRSYSQPSGLGLGKLPRPLSMNNSGAPIRGTSEHHRIASQNERTPDGVPEAEGGFPAHPPGRMTVVPRIRWCSLAALARPPANFHDASGVAKCMTGSKAGDYFPPPCRPQYFLNRSSIPIFI